MRTAGGQQQNTVVEGTPGRKSSIAGLFASSLTLPEEDHHHENTTMDVEDGVNGGGDDGSPPKKARTSMMVLEGDDDNDKGTTPADDEDTPATKKKPRTYISRLVVTFKECLAQLNAKDIHDAKLESMAVIIHECMSSASRQYHSVQHVFDISKDLTDPIVIIAALFHDLIYYNVDGGLSPLQMEMLEGVFNEENPQNKDTTSNNNTKTKRNSSGGGVVLTNPYRQRRSTVMKRHDDWCVAHRSKEDPLLCMVERVFGYPKGSEITAKNGINEFLSAVVAVRQLECHLTKEQLAQIACCIEATIPFNHSTGAEGDNNNKNDVHMERLYQNMVATREACSLKLTDDELVQSVHLAAALANEDIANFGTDDRYWFLDNTWSLLPETNTGLRQQFLYTIMEYQKAVFKMNGFFHFLKPHVIFCQFRGVPATSVIEEWTNQARRNLELGRKYVGAKLLSASVLAAFAHLTGGDCPMSLIMGDLPSRHHNSEKLEDSLPTPSEQKVEAHCDVDVYKILSGGRRSESTFDTKQSPLAAYLYAKLGDELLMQIVEENTLDPIDDDDNARALLVSLPRESVKFLATIMSTIAVSRSTAILQLLEELPTESAGVGAENG